MLKNRIQKSEFPFRFFIITFLWSWSLWISLALMEAGIIPLGKKFISALSFPMVLLGAFGPVIGALVSLRTINGKGAIRSFLQQFISLRFGAKVWCTILLVFGLSTAFCWILPELWGEERAAMILPNVWIFPLYWLLIVLLGGGQEEIGWRGYIMPFMEKKFGFIMGTLLLGTLWACWHLPLWFIEGTSQTYMNFFGFIMLMVGYSFIFSWVVKTTGNRLLSGLVAHGTANAFVPLFTVLIMEDGVPQIRFWLWVSLTLLIGMVFMVITLKQTGLRNQYKKVIHKLIK